ncbi:unnamed protein product [Trichobilharzia regenti]|nr:unnamed protein product [Trichobilharzia regenti]
MLRWLGSVQRRTNDRNFTASELNSEDQHLMLNPYVKPKKKCFICEKNIPLDYKNVRLLSQFVSPYTGRIYGRHITGMCIPMQKRISQLITKSRQFGFMIKVDVSLCYNRVFHTVPRHSFLFS